MGTDNKFWDLNSTASKNPWIDIIFLIILIQNNFIQFQLVRMLTPREIQEARDIFHAFDKDEDGYINSYEAAKGFGRWFGNLRIKDAKSNCR